MKFTRDSIFARRLLVFMLLIAHPSARAIAQTVTSNDLAQASIEELMTVRITSAERKEQRPEDVAAPVYVITQDDIRRSGLTKLPEIFRLVPGVQVAQVNANEWAVSVRGFNSLYSDKLLVLVDGRSLYNRGFSGVFWDGQNMMASDIERIEVIRGPGGTVWGANAVNGVINIITKSAAQTKGTAVELSAGNFERDSGAIRYGGALGNVNYRVYSQWSEHAGGLTNARTPANDGWNAFTTGFRADWSRGADSVMAEGSFMDTQARPGWVKLNGFFNPPSTDGVSDVDEVTGLGRWTHRTSNGSLVQLQAFRTLAHRDEVTLYQSERTGDIDVQYQTTVGSRHEIVAGGGFRDSDLFTVKTFTLDIPSDETEVFNAFVQDEVSVSKAVKVTLGSKLEHDTYAGWGLLPSARVMWNIDPSQRAWAAVSRARRTPGAAFRSMKIYVGAIPGENGLPIVFRSVGNPDSRSEELIELEGGYRYQFGPTASIDVAAFRGHYDHATTVETIAPAFALTPAPHVLIDFQYDNLLHVDSRGFEVAGRWMPLSKWRLDASYSNVFFTPDLHPASTDATASSFDGNAPQHQWQLHSTTWLTPRIELDGGLFYVGRLRQLDIPAYTRADARLEFKLTNHLAAIAAGQNLLQSAHAEFSSANTGLVGSLVPRSGRVQLRWQF
jgi:iron complex outermembrane receptor protein